MEIWMHKNSENTIDGRFLVVWEKDARFKSLLGFTNAYNKREG